MSGKKDTISKVKKSDIRYHYRIDDRYLEVHESSDGSLDLNLYNPNFEVIDGDMLAPATLEITHGSSNLWEDSVVEFSDTVPEAIKQEEVIEVASVQELEKQIIDKLFEFREFLIEESNDLKELNEKEMGYDKEHQINKRVKPFLRREGNRLIGYDEVGYKYQIGKEYHIEDEDFHLFSVDTADTRKREESIEIICEIPELLLWKERVGEKNMAEEKTKEKGNRNEKMEQLEQIIQDISEGWDKNPELIAEALEFGEKFHHYSIKNQMLIHAQNPYAMYVASFNKWNELGARINKGEHGLQVFVPVKATYIETTDKKTNQPAFVPLRYATAEEKQAYKAGKLKGIEKLHFKAGTVFDISQTNYPKEKYPELFHMGYSKEESRQIVEGMINFSMEKLQCPVEMKDLSSITLRGYYYPKYNRICLNEKMEDTAKMSTLSHELGHAMIHRESNDKSTHRKEFEADAVSILISTHFGEEISESSKSHFVSHYEALKEEVEKSDEDFNISECLSDVMKVYKEHIDDLDQSVQKVIENEKGKHTEKTVETAEDRLCKAYAASRPATFEHSRGREK